MKKIAIAALVLLASACQSTPKPSNAQNADQNFEQRRKDIQQQNPPGRCCEALPLPADSSAPAQAVVAPEVKVEKKD